MLHYSYIILCYMESDYRKYSRRKTEKNSGEVIKFGENVRMEQN